MLLSRVNSNRLLLPLHLESGIPTLCFLGGSVGKEYACNAGDMGLISGAERFPEERHGNPLQYSCLENPLGRGAWRAAVVGSHGVSESDTTEGTEYTYACAHVDGLCASVWLLDELLPVVCHSFHSTSPLRRRVVGLFLYFYLPYSGIVPCTW